MSSAITVGCRIRPGLFLTFSVGLAVFPGISLPALACLAHSGYLAEPDVV